jgi:hypothetical protein
MCVCMCVCVYESLFVCILLCYYYSPRFQLRIIIFFFVALQPTTGIGRLVLRFLYHAQTHTHNRTLTKRSARSRGRYLRARVHTHTHTHTHTHAQQTQEMIIHTLSGFRTRIPSSQASADPRLIQTGKGIGLELLRHRTYYQFLSK